MQRRVSSLRVALSSFALHWATFLRLYNWAESRVCRTFSPTTASVTNSAFLLSSARQRAMQ